MPKPLDPNSIPKYVNQLFIPPTYEPTVVRDSDSCTIKGHFYRITVSQFKQQILPEGFPETTVYGYESKVRDPETGDIIPDFKSAPGPTFEAVRHIPIKVQWVNNLTSPQPLAVDPTIH
ncbi:MAG: copper oxidase, partial [Bacillota bacterium]